MITVGGDTYVTVDEATTYIEQQYLSTDIQRKAWEGMAQADREICLRCACAALESLRYRGVKFAFMQQLAFPRYFGENYAMLDGVLYAPEVARYPQLKEVPAAVKAAQVEEALEIASPTNATQNRKIRNGAVRSYSIGHFSETFETAVAGSVAAVLASAKAQELIRQYTGGGFDVR